MADMDRELERILKEIVDKHGKGILLENRGRRAVGYVADLLPGAKKEKRLLRTALNEGIADKINEEIILRGQNPFICRNRYVLWLCDDLIIERKAAVFIVDCICGALGIGGSAIASSGAGQDTSQDIVRGVSQGIADIVQGRRLDAAQGTVQRIAQSMSQNIVYGLGQGTDTFDETKEQVLGEGTLAGITDPVRVYEILKKYTVIGYEAFKRCKCRIIRIPKNIRRIQESGFYHWHGEKLILPGEIEIEPGAFYEAYLHAVELPLGARHLAENGCLVDRKTGTLVGTYVYAKRMVYAKQMEERPDGVPWGRKIVSYIDIPEGVVRIPRMAINDLFNKIYLPQTVKQIDLYDRFGVRSAEWIDVDEGNENYKSIDGVLFGFQGRKLLRYPNKREERNYVLPSGTESIGEWAFSGTDIEIVNINAELQEIGYNAFRNCKKLVEINVEPENGNYQSIDGVLFDARAEKLLLYPEDGDWEYALPSGTKSIGEEAFSNVWRIESIKFNAELQEIGENAFWGCTNLEQIDVEPENENYQSIDGVLFDARGKKLLLYPSGKGEEYTLPSGTESIGEGAFSGTEIKRVCLNAELQEIGENAFWGCEYLKEICVDYGSRNYQSIDGVLFDARGKKLVLYPSRKGEAYALPSGTESIGKWAFSGTDISEVSLNPELREIGDNAFWLCEHLLKIATSGGLKRIGREAFAACNLCLRLLKLDNDPVVEIGEDAFEVYGLYLDYQDYCLDYYTSGKCNRREREVSLRCIPRDIKQFPRFIQCKSDSYLEEYCIKNGIPCGPDFEEYCRRLLSGMK